MRHTYEKSRGDTFSLRSSDCFFRSLQTVSDKPRSTFKHEQQTIVDAIGKDITQIVIFAASKKDPLKLTPDSITLETNEVDRTNFDYNLKWNGGGAQMKMPLNDFVWNPSNYTGWVKQLCDSLGTETSTGTGSAAELVAELGNFSTEVLKERNKTISDELGKDPLNAKTNEQAALLCSTFALRESAGCFSDLRPWLNRISTHLAIAEYARQKETPSLAGQLSKMVLYSLAGRQSEALKMAAELENKGKVDNVLKSWLRAIKIRATHDYRLFDKNGALLIEKLEYARAIADLKGSDALTDYLRENKPEDDAGIDWIRIGAHGGPSVESGHIYIKEGISAELDDAAKDLFFFKDVKAKDLGSIIEELKQEPAGCMEKKADGWHAVPISWSNLSAFHSRQVLDAVYQTYDFFENNWGVHEDAEKLFDSANKNFSSLPLYPFCKMSCELAKDHKHAIEPDLLEQLSKLTYHSPQTITFYVWHRASAKIPAGTAQDAEHWFDPICPTNTAFDYDHRRPTNLPDLEKLLVMDPYDRQLLIDYAKRKYKVKKEDGIDGAQLEKTLAPIIAYDVKAMKAIAENYWEQEDMDGYARAVERTSAFSPDSWFFVGQCYENKNPKKAFEAYEKGVKLARNEVLKANSCYWLVDYYLAHGQKDKGLKLAEECGEVYSASGLRTQAYAYEKLDRMDDAVKTLEKLKERYDMDDDLNYFYARNMDKPYYKDQGQQFINKIFPAGLKKFDATQGAPKTGVVVQSYSLRSNDAGVKVGDVIVAVNGWQVANAEQFKLASQLKLSPAMEYTIWNEDKFNYKMAKLNTVDHRIGCELEPFKGGSS